MTEELDRASEQTLDLAKYWAIARRRHGWFSMAAFLTWLAVWSVSWIIPSVYRSGALILVEQASVPQQYVVSNIAMDMKNRLDSMTQQILSRTRLLHLIDNLNLYANDRNRLSTDELIERMRKDIDIELVRSPDRDVTAFNVYYLARDPRVAQQVTSELTNLFISENLEFRQQLSEGTTEFLGSQLEEARKSLAEQEQRIREFKDKNLGELPTQLQGNIQILSGLQGQLQAEQDAFGRAKQQNIYLESLLAEYRDAQMSTKNDDTAPQGLPAIDQELTRLKSQLRDLLSRYTEKHPDVRKLKEQIAKTEGMKQQIQADLRAGASSSEGKGDKAGEASAYAESTPMMELQSQLKANQAEIANRQQSVQELKTRIAEYQSRLNQTPVREQQLADLSRDYDQSRTNYESLLAKKDQSELATNLEKRQRGEHFRIVDPASLPTKPFWPNRLVVNLIGLLGGLVVGAVVAGVMESADDRLYGEKELRALVPLEVLVELPPIPTVAELERERRKTYLGYVYVGLMLVTILAGMTVSYLRG